MKRRIPRVISLLIGIFTILFAFFLLTSILIANKGDYSIFYMSFVTFWLLLYGIWELLNSTTSANRSLGTEQN